MSLLRPVIQDDRGERVESVITWKAAQRTVFLSLFSLLCVGSIVALEDSTWPRLILAVGFTPVILMGLWSIRGEPARARAANRDAHACPACLYVLKNLAPEPDGCTVCPECGAAWRLDSADSARSA